MQALHEETQRLRERLAVLGETVDRGVQLELEWCAAPGGREAGRCGELGAPATPDPPGMQGTDKIHLPSLCSSCSTAQDRRGP